MKVHIVHVLLSNGELLTKVCASHDAAVREAVAATTTIFEGYGFDQGEITAENWESLLSDYSVDFSDARGHEDEFCIPNVEISEHEVVQ